MVVNSTSNYFHFIWSHDYIYYSVSSEPVCIYVILTRKDGWDMHEVKFLLEKIQRVVAKIISGIFSNLFCIFGIGLTSLVAKIVGKKFLRRKYKHSSWVQSNSKANIHKQF